MDTFNALFPTDKFKVGDKVRYIGEAVDLTKGALGVVTKIDALERNGVNINPWPYTVDFEGQVDGLDYPCSDRELELIAE